MNDTGLYREGKVKVRMDDYVEKMIQTFPQKLNSIDMAITPAGNDLYENGNGGPLGESQSEYFHTMVAKDMFLSNRERPDIQHTVAVLDTRVRSPNMIYWSKMVRVLKYLHFTRKYHLTLSIHDMRVINWYADTSFAVHPNFKSHTGGIMMWVPGENKSRSMKQKLNTRSSTDAEVVGVDNTASNILWKNCLLRIKYTMLNIIFSIKITRVLFSWRRMQERELVR